MENHMNDGMVQLNKVTKAYGSFQLDCSMEVQPGMATGFVGANGAGKTTTFQILLGLVPPETGEIRIFGKPYTELTAKDRERIGVSLRIRASASSLPSGMLPPFCGICIPDLMRPGSWKNVSGMNFRRTKKSKIFLPGCRQS